MRAYLFQRFLTILCGIVFAFSLIGCGTYEYVTVQSSYLSASTKVLPNSTAVLPTKAQDEADKRRLALPPELRERLQAIVAQTWNERPDPRFIGDHASDIPGLHNKMDRLLWRMTIETLRWAAKETPEERAAHLQVRQLQPLPPVKVEAPPVVNEPITLEHPAVQAGGGFVSGLAIGPVPFGPMAADVAIQLNLLPNGTYWARVGKACGEVVIGTGQIILGCGGMGAGVGVSGTGAGAPAGVLLFAESMAIAGNGILTAGHGVVDGVRLLREGPPPEEPPAPSEVKLLARKGDPKPAQQPQPAAAPTPQTPPKAAGAPAAAPKPGAARPSATTPPQAKPAPAGQTPSGVAKGAKRGPKTDPDAPHNAAIRKEAEKLRQEGNTIVHGGKLGGKEEVVKIKEGVKSARRPDITYRTPDGQLRGRNVGKTNADGTPVKREAEALKDLNDHSDRPTDFSAYDR